MKDRSDRIFYVCPRCGMSIVNEEECTFCGSTMIKTPYTEDDYIKAGNSKKFFNKLLNEYVYGNPLYSEFEYQRREEEKYRRYRGSSVLRCPSCGSTAVTTGQRGYSAVYGFAGSARTVNRCGNCGYSWEP
ncbi:MAG: hypothetical protein HFI65_00780 [Lachnospiraceae bacterium]|nr:hypothetical protein [Lachnospiraceae bacterium]